MARMQHFLIECTVDGCTWRVNVAGYDIKSKTMEYLLRIHGDEAKHYAMKVTGRVVDTDDGDTGRDLSV